jgi:hypothetical protein
MMIAAGACLSTGSGEKNGKRIAAPERSRRKKWASGPLVAEGRGLYNTDYSKPARRGQAK